MTQVMPAPAASPTAAPTLRAATADDVEAIAELWHLGWPVPSRRYQKSLG
ncbi:MAG: hypothetical protein ACRDTM_14295 [Micromonosporaceae bacterium]